MKKTILILSLMIGTVVAHATTYYFSTSLGSYTNAITSTLAQSQSTPYRCVSTATLDSVLSGQISKLIPKAGDSVLLKRGDVFFGPLTPTTVGTPTARVVLSSWGTGAKPIINVGPKLTTWVQKAGTNIWQNTTNNPQTNPVYILVDGEQVGYGRYPNPNNNADHGWLAGDVKHDYLDSTATDFVLSTSAYTTRTDGVVQLQQTDLKGQRTQVVYRANRYAISTPRNLNKVSYSGTTATFQFDDPGLVINCSGYFLQNNIKFLDQSKEWCYDSSGVLSVYFAAGDNPSNHTIEMPIYDNGIDLPSTAVDWTINDISVINANGIGINSAAKETIISNCYSRGAGNSNVQVKGSNSVLTKDTFSLATRYGVRLYATGSRMDHSEIDSVNMVYGVGGGGTVAGSGMDLKASNLTVEWNHINNVAYACININPYSGQTIQYNVLQNTNMRIDDGGAIYTINRPETKYTGQLMKQNVIRDFALQSPWVGVWDNGKKAWQTDNQTQSLYCDQRTNATKWDGNIMIGGTTAYFLNDPFNDTMVNGLFINQSRWILRMRNAHSDKVISGNYVNNNVFFDTSISGNPAKADFNSISNQELPSTYGKMDHNFFVYPYLRNPAIYTDEISSATTPTYTFTGWKAKYPPLDASSDTTFKVLSTTTNRPDTSTMWIVNETETPQTYTLNNKKWIGGRGTHYDNNTITLQPMTGEVFMFNGNLTSTPPPPPPPSGTGIYKFKRRKQYMILTR